MKLLAFLLFDPVPICIIIECVSSARIVFISYICRKPLYKLDLLQVDPTTGEAEDDGVEDEYQLEDLEIVSADYMLKVGVSNFRNAWESLGPEFERVDEYGLGPRESLAEAVNTVTNLLGLQPCEVSQRCYLLLFLLFVEKILFSIYVCVCESGCTKFRIHDLLLTTQCPHH